jgi:hypothetical protein
VNWLDLLLGRLNSGEGVRSDILSLESTLSALTGIIPVAAKLFRTIFG